MNLRHFNWRDCDEFVLYVSHIYKMWCICRCWESIFGWSSCGSTNIVIKKLHSGGGLRIEKTFINEATILFKNARKYSLNYRSLWQTLCAIMLELCEFDFRPFTREHKSRVHTKTWSTPKRVETSRTHPKLPTFIVKLPETSHYF